ncbi:hypothetical protein BRADI_2g59950v3 [Brachypodium distachyon]|uniref:PsbP C-terminal domain-containing protein n=1 Tax=Brachypodium distachyon TaxID=15368 RepID=A0A0Q3GLR1_BRADI|nr:hypothetical protein BRADI_2g59950v3 [Brachypodium distachyon]
MSGYKESGPCCYNLLYPSAIMPPMGLYGWIMIYLVQHLGPGTECHKCSMSSWLIIDEFIYPANWVGDQTILYNQVKKAELQRSLDPPPLTNGRSPSRPSNISGPVAAFGPPGSNGELNVSVIVSPVPQDFSIEAFGGPKDVGEVVLRRIARTKRNPDISATLIDAALREDTVTNVKYYKLEFRVESPSFRRHNVAVCCVRDGKLYTLNAQAPESAWRAVQNEFFAMADSFSLVIDV